MDAFGNEHSALCAHFECGMPDIEVFRRANGWVDLWFETDNAGDSGQWMFRFDGDTLIEAISHEEWYKRKGFN